MKTGWFKLAGYDGYIANEQGRVIREAYSAQDRNGMWRCYKEKELEVQTRRGTGAYFHIRQPGVPGYKMLLVADIPSLLVKPNTASATTIASTTASPAPLH